MDAIQPDFEFKQYAENAILITTSSKIDKILLHELVFYKNLIENNYIEVIVEVVLSYNSLLVLYKLGIEDFYSEVLELKSLYFHDCNKKKEKKRLWQIPVCYSVSIVPELISFAAHKSLSVGEVVSLHTAPLYVVHFIGFLPGFLYLSGLDEKLITERKLIPSLDVKKGSVAIGGNQTGVYPSDSPGGWHIIGKTPLTFFDVQATNCCFIKPGDELQFISIKEKEYNDIKKLVLLEVYHPKFKML
ncbi:hypothetical protein GCM10022393_22720 [Aquimarina addita]|uniref:Carboxyltransferase domain-containing protein n=1 Tax=Aquimarina addita TaxID=870485 RepID=A0ABP6UKR2_9FLAO